eukprot:scaffold791_cov115-Cylindrotheca_fusiformis.AAC.11
MKHVWKLSSGVATTSPWSFLEYLDTSLNKRADYCTVDNRELVFPIMLPCGGLSLSTADHDRHLLGMK